MKIAISGRGGVGKTSFIALSTLYFLEKKEYSPLLLVDADSDENLSASIGIDKEKENIKTISEILFDVLKGKDIDELGMLPPTLRERIEFQLYRHGIYEGKNFDLISIGAKFTQGCYCLANNILRDILKKYEKNYKITLIDSPAGFEHLNRMIAPDIDNILVLIDSTPKSINHAKNAYRICKEININFKNFYIIANHSMPEEISKTLEEKTGLKFIGKVEYDKKLEDYLYTGKSLLEIPKDSYAFTSISKILERIIV